MSDAHLGTDLALEQAHAAFRPVYRLAVRGGIGREDGRVRRRIDFGTADGRGNLGQAIVARLLTPRGELSALGHPGYGSRLHSLIGRRNTPSTRGLARLYILEALQQEPRLAAVELLDVATKPGTRDVLVVRLRASVVGSDAPFDLGPFEVELAS